MSLVHRCAVLLCWFSALAPAAALRAEDAPAKPNIVVIFTDDQGYGDLGCYGATDYKTPRIDELAEQGTRFTSFYAQIVCGPSRSALLTGRYPIHSLGWSMPASEVTIAELLQKAGYRTACFGKWDVSNRAAILDRMPVAQGFDYYFGPLGANDNGRVKFHENNEPAGGTGDMGSLTELYTDKAIEFVEQSAEEPFFLYLAHTMVHSVIGASDEFRGKSDGELYGDTMQELDFNVGRLLDTLDRRKLSDRTLVIFTSDNGPWSNIEKRLRQVHDGQLASGSPGPLRGAKGSTYEGGLRVPCIVRWPGQVPAGRESDAVFATIDFLPTFCKLTGAELPTNRHLDGVDQTALLMGESEEGARDEYFYFCRGEMHAYRHGKWKLILPDRKEFYGYVKDRGSSDIELYDLESDIGESNNVADQHPEVVRKMLEAARAYEMPKVPYDPRIRT